MLTAAVGYVVYQWMEAADVGYLDLERPLEPEVLCVKGVTWPVRHQSTTWLSWAKWTDWLSYRIDMEDFVKSNRCNWNFPDPKCGQVSVPLHYMNRTLGIPLKVAHYNWRNDCVEMYGFLFLWMTVCLWVVLTVHDMALLTVRNRDYIYDLRGVRKNFPRWRILYAMHGFRCWKRMLRGAGIVVGKKVVFGNRRWLPAFAVALAPLFVCWGFAVFFIVSVPVMALMFLRYPVRLSRVLLFVNCVATAIFGVMLTIHMLYFLANRDSRQAYAVTWSVQNATTGEVCDCGCQYGIRGSRCAGLALIGVVVCYKSLNLAFRSLKGLRRSNWANLMSVLFPVPLSVYEVSWTRPDGTPIQHRSSDQPVQGELAFDPYALMDEQVDSARTTLNLVPVAKESGWEPQMWTADGVEQYLKYLKMDRFVAKVQANQIDGKHFVRLNHLGKLVEFFKEEGMQQKHVDKIQHHFGKWKADSCADIGMDAMPTRQPRLRSNAGPSVIGETDIDVKKRHLEYIGCCGFPCIRHEFRASYKPQDSDSEEESVNYDAERDASRPRDNGGGQQASPQALRPVGSDGPDADTMRERQMQHPQPAAGDSAEM